MHHLGIFIFSDRAHCLSQIILSCVRDLLSQTLHRWPASHLGCPGPTGCRCPRGGSISPQSHLVPDGIKTIIGPLSHDKHNFIIRKSVSRQFLSSVLKLDRVAPLMATTS